MKHQSKLIAVDLDDTLCYRPSGIEDLGQDKYKQCKPILDNIEYVNELYDAGNEIVIYTARGMYTFNMDVAKVYANLYESTCKQLQEWGIKYHRLIMGKQPYDFLLDDKALSLREMNLLDSYK